MRYFFILLFFAGVAEAQWSNCWPSWEYPRMGNTQLDNLYTATVERCLAFSGFSLPSKPTWWRTRRSSIQNIKNVLAGHLFYSHSTGSQVFGWVISEGINSNDFQTIASNIVNLESLCAKAGVPTNFFDYTPFRGLNGLGPFTNDASLEHPHGWTNEWTANGGTNFPSGRSCWYTTDYGFDGIKSVLTNMNIFVYNDHINEWSYFSPRQPIQCYMTNDANVVGNDSSFAVAAAQVEASWIGENLEFLPDDDYWKFSYLFALNDLKSQPYIKSWFNDELIVVNAGSWKWWWTPIKEPIHYLVTAPICASRSYYIDIYSAWHGSKNWFGFPGNAGETNLWERLVSDEGGSTNLVGNKEWCATVNLPTIAPVADNDFHCSVGFHPVQEEHWLTLQTASYVVYYDFIYK